MIKDENPEHEALRDDPDFYFDENNFSTLVLNSEDYSKKHFDEIKNLVKLLTSGDRDTKEEALKLLKTDDGRDLLMSAITSKEYRDDRAALVAACWESGLDFTQYFEFFIHLVLAGDYLTCMEAVTVIENMEGKISPEIKRLASEKLQEGIEAGSEKKEFFADVVAFLHSTEGN